MSNIPCNVNKDLLPLYVDNVCSEESKNMVEEHLAGCGECRKYYDALQKGIPEERLEEEKEGLLSEEKLKEAAVSVIRSTKKEISKSQTRKIAGVIAVFIIILIVLEGLNSPHMGPIIDLRLKVDDMHITETYQLKSGEFYITLEPDKKCTISYAGNLQEVCTEKNELTGEYMGFFGLQNNPLEVNAVPIKSCSFIFPLSGKAQEGDGKVVEREDSVIYLEGKGDEKIKVWEKGQKVKKAPPEIEAKARKALEEERTLQKKWQEESLQNGETAEQYETGVCTIVESEKE